MEDTYGYQTDYIKLYEQAFAAQSSYYTATVFGYTLTTVAYTMTNSVVNKVGDITLTGFDLLSANNADYIVFEVEQSSFPDIGRAQMFTCGVHKCSKFNKPVQYFILYPQTALTRY